MRFLFRYVDGEGRPVEVAVDSMEELAARIQAGEVGQDTLLYDELTGDWTPTRFHDVYPFLLEGTPSPRPEPDPDEEELGGLPSFGVTLDETPRAPISTEESVRSLLKEKERERRERGEDDGRMSFIARVDSATGLAPRPAGKAHDAGQQQTANPQPTRASSTAVPGMTVAAGPTSRAVGGAAPETVLRSSPVSPVTVGTTTGIGAAGKQEAGKPEAGKLYGTTGDDRDRRTHFASGRGGRAGDGVAERSGLPGPVEPSKAAPGTKPAEAPGPIPAEQLPLRQPPPRPSSDIEFLWTPAPRSSARPDGLPPRERPATAVPGLTVVPASPRPALGRQPATSALGAHPLARGQRPATASLQVNMLAPRLRPATGATRAKATLSPQVAAIIGPVVDIAMLAPEGVDGAVTGMPSPAPVLAGPAALPAAAFSAASSSTVRGEPVCITSLAPDASRTPTSTLRARLARIGTLLGAWGARGAGLARRRARLQTAAVAAALLVGAAVAPAMLRELGLSPVAASAASAPGLFFQPFQRAYQEEPRASAVAVTLAGTESGAFHDLRETMDSVRAAYAVERVPESWLGGRYLADAGDYPEVAAYWTRYLDFVAALERDDRALFERSWRQRAQADEPAARMVSIRLPRALESFEMTAPLRERTYGDMRLLATSSLALHELLVARAADIRYDPVEVGGADQARTPLDPALRAGVTGLLDDIFASLERIHGAGLASRSEMSARILGEVGATAPRAAKDATRLSVAGREAEG